MSNTGSKYEGISRDLVSGLVVFLIALPLCLGIALASDAPLFSGILAGIVGGLVVGVISGSHTSVSGPAAGLTAVVAAQIASLESYEAFLVAVFIGGVIQLGLGVMRAGALAEYFPTSVIKGLLAAIGVILILKQIPHLFGHDSDPEGESAFQQPDGETTFSELVAMFNDLSPGAALVGLFSLALLIGWTKIPKLRESRVPVSLVVVLLGVLWTLILRAVGGQWEIGTSHLVGVPKASSLGEFWGFLTWPDWSALNTRFNEVLLGGITIAIVASLETLLNLEAVDRLDPEQRVSPPNRELLAQGCGNITCGLIGGLPVTSVIIRSSVNIHSGNKSKMSTIFHGFLLVMCVMLIPQYLNLIPLSSLAAILLVTGYKLANPKQFKQMWAGGPNQFLPFVMTIVAIVLTDLLVGILIGLAVSVIFILRGNLRQPIRRFTEERMGEEVVRVELANHVSFLNRAALSRCLNEVPSGGHILLDGRLTRYMDPDIQDELIDFEAKTAPARGVKVSLLGFEQLESLRDRIHFAEHADLQLQRAATPQDALQLLKKGNERFRSGYQMPRDLRKQQAATAGGQFPLAAVLGCIDSRAPSELIFDLGLGDIFSIRIAGNVAREKVVGSIEYACGIAGTKLVVVLGHTRCGAVTSAVDLHLQRKTSAELFGLSNIDVLVSEIQKSIVPSELEGDIGDAAAKELMIDNVARNNVLRTVQKIRHMSPPLDKMAKNGEIAIVGALYDVLTGAVEFFPDTVYDERRFDLQGQT